MASSARDEPLQRAVALREHLEGRKLGSDVLEQTHVTGRACERRARCARRHEATSTSAGSAAPVRRFSRPSPVEAKPAATNTLGQRATGRVDAVDRRHEQRASLSAVDEAGQGARELARFRPVPGEGEQGVSGAAEPSEQVPVAEHDQCACRPLRPGVARGGRGPLEQRPPGVRGIGRGEDHGGRRRVRIARSSAGARRRPAARTARRRDPRRSSLAAPGPGPRAPGAPA